MISKIKRCSRAYNFGVYRNLWEFWFCVLMPKWVLNKVYLDTPRVKLFGLGNLNCPGIQIGKQFYMDVFNSWGLKGVFANVNGRQYWWTLNSLSTGKVRNNFRKVRRTG